MAPTHRGGIIASMENPRIDDRLGRLLVLRD
jgi:hypothetical protein